MKEATANTTDLERAWEKHSAAITVMNENARLSGEHIAMLADAAVDALPFGVGPDLEEEEENEFEK